MFHDIAYKAKDRQDLLAGIEEFLDEVIVLPPGEWDPEIRIEPPKSLPSSDKRFALIPSQPNPNHYGHEHKIYPWCTNQKKTTKRNEISNSGQSSVPQSSRCLTSFF